MKTTLDISIVYGICTLTALLLAAGYCAFVKKKEIWLIWLYISVFIANLGYFTLSISKNLEEALLANRLAYLGCVFLPLFMLMTIMKVCLIKCKKSILLFLLTISFSVFFIAASQGYADWYYKDVTMEVVDGMAKLHKEYGPLHGVYYVYLFSYLLTMIGVVCYATAKKKITSYKHAALLAVVVLFNIAIWLVEQFIDWNFEFLAVSYIASELLLLFLYGMIQDYESAVKERTLDNPEALEVRKAEDAMEHLTCCLPQIDKLSEREKDVLKKIIEGKKRKEIAQDLFITENTVKKHITNIFSKLNVSNRTELFDKINVR